jgi:HEAT repeat protein
VFSDYPAVSACIAALAALGNTSSFPALFSVMPAGYPDSIVQESASALESIRGDYQGFLIDVIRQNPPAEKLAAFRAGAENQKSSDQERAELAQIALEVSLDFLTSSGDRETAASEMRYAAVRLLGDLRWTRATRLAVRHFYRVQQDFNNGTASRERFLEAITCLGAMGSSEAAQPLVLQLGLFNSRMERNGEFDDAVTLGAVEALGEIGDKLAFDYLLYMSYLPYPEPIQPAAKEALRRLKW